MVSTAVLAHCCKQCQGLYCRPFNRNVTYKSDFPSSVHIHFNDKETNTGMCHYGLRSTGCCLNQITISNHQIKNKKRFWFSFKCVSSAEVNGSPYGISPSHTKLTVENETQTEEEAISMVSNTLNNGCSRGTVQDELTLYMEEIHRRENKYEISQ